MNGVFVSHQTNHLSTWMPTLDNLTMSTSNFLNCFSRRHLHLLTIIYSSSNSFLNIKASWTLKPWLASIIFPGCRKSKSPHFSLMSSSETLPPNPLDVYEIAPWGVIPIQKMYLFMLSPSLSSCLQGLGPLTENLKTDVLKERGIFFNSSSLPGRLINGCSLTSIVSTHFLDFWLIMLNLDRIGSAEVSKAITNSSNLERGSLAYLTDVWSNKDEHCHQSCKTMQTCQCNSALFCHHLGMSFHWALAHWQIVSLHFTHSPLRLLFSPQRLLHSSSTLGVDSYVCHWCGNFESIIVVTLNTEIMSAASCL